MAHPVTPALSTKSKSTGPGPLNSRSPPTSPPSDWSMQANRIPIEDEEAIENHPHLLDYIKEIVDRTRNSSMSLEWQQNVKKKRNEYATRNESNWINKSWPALINTEGERNVHYKEETSSPLDRDLSLAKLDTCGNCAEGCKHSAVRWNAMEITGTEKIQHHFPFIININVCLTKLPNSATTTFSPEQAYTPTATLWSRC